ncbi:MAG: M23 family metallopeptidase [Longimicrobiaceae bacterium]
MPMHPIPNRPQPAGSHPRPTPHRHRRPGIAAAVALLLLGSAASASGQRPQQLALNVAVAPRALGTVARGTGGSALLIPVAGVSGEMLRDSYREGRSGGRVHHAIDIPAPLGTPVVAVADGEVLRLHSGERGGLSLYLLDADGATRYYYAHLDHYAADVHEGVPVRRGDVIGYVGDTGNAQPGDYHLHFSIALLDDPRRWWEGDKLNPYPLLRGPLGDR